MLLNPGNAAEKKLTFYLKMLLSDMKRCMFSENLIFSTTEDPFIQKEPQSNTTKLFRNMFFCIPKESFSPIKGGAFIVKDIVYAK